MLLLLYIFEKQHMNVKSDSITIRSKKKVLKSSSLLRPIYQLLKWDLKPLLFCKNDKLGYGVKCRLANNMLEFFGTVKEDIMNKTLVIQITHRRGRIMREIWVYGTVLISELQNFTSETMSNETINQHLSKTESSIL